MIACKHCETKNSLDSQFCKSCGLELPEADRAEARLATEKLVADGYAMLAQGRTEESALVAEKVLEDDPNSTEALSLMGMCHERNHDILAALECYERVMELKPDSALDKIKVTQLRNALTRQSKEEARPNRAMALAGAAAAVILVGSIGGIVATVAARPASASVVSNDPSAGTYQGAPFSNRETQVKAPTPNVPVQNPTVDTTGGTPRNPIQPPIHFPRAGDQGGLPAPTAGGTKEVLGTDTGERPVQPDITLVPTGNTGGAVNPDDPTPDQNRNVESAPPVEDLNKGIEINVHKGASGPPGGSQDMTKNDTDGAGLQTLLKVAREQFMLGKWQSAAGAYERALRFGGDAGGINQRIGQCYERMGKTSDAIGAYGRAESALQSAVNNGRGSAKPALESVRQSLKNLRGQ